MRRILPIVGLIFSLLSGRNALGALASTTVWQAQPTATAADVNACGFNPSNASVGTDRSQTDSAFATGTDLLTSNGTSTPCTVSTTSSHSFTSADNGNLIHINSGGTFTAGWYEVVSTAGGAATLDRACASGASTSGGTYHLGGACSLNSANDNTWAGIVVAGNTVWFTGALTLGSSVTFANTTATTGIQLLGFNSSRGDNPTGSNRPSVNCGSSSTFTVGTGNVLKNMTFTGSAANVLSGGSAGTVYNVKSVNTSTTTGRNAIAMTTNGAVINSEFVSYNGNGIGSGNGGTLIEGCYIHDSNNGISISATTLGVHVINSIIESNTTSAISLTAAQANTSVIEGNTLYGGENKTGTGISMTAGSSAIRVFNNIIYGFATGVSNGDLLTDLFDGFNDYFNNTADTSNWTKGTGDVALNPGFNNLAQLTGTTATTSGTTLTDSGQNFGTVTNNRDFVNVTASTGGTVGQYLITAHTTTTLTTDNTLGSGSSVHYQVTTGRNFAVGPNLVNKGFPGVFPASITSGFLTIGAPQKMPGLPRKSNGGSH